MKDGWDQIVVTFVSLGLNNHQTRGIVNVTLVTLGEGVMYNARGMGCVIMLSTAASVRMDGVETFVRYLVVQVQVKTAQDTATATVPSMCATATLAGKGKAVKYLTALVYQTAMEMAFAMEPQCNR